MRDVDPALALAAALTDDQRAAIIARLLAQYPGWEGVEVADILDETDQTDSDLEITEPFFEANPDLIVVGAGVAARALIWSGTPLTVETFRGLLTAAGLLAAPPPLAIDPTNAAIGALLVYARDPEHDFAGWLAHILAAVAADLGSSDALIAGRPGSWEASSVDQLVKGTVGWADEYLAGSKAARPAVPEIPEQVVTVHDKSGTPYLVKVCGAPADGLFIDPVIEGEGCDEAAH